MFEDDHLTKLLQQAFVNFGIYFLTPEERTASPYALPYSLLLMDAADKKAFWIMDFDNWQQPKEYKAGPATEDDVLERYGEEALEEVRRAQR